MDALLYVLTFALIAAAVYFIDKRFGAPVYRSCYNLWHKELLPDGIMRGFIVGRKAKEKILPSLVLTIIFGFLLSYFIHDPVELVMKSPLIFFGLTVGFMLTGFAMREGKKTDSVVDKVCAAMDDIEEGNLDLSGAAGSAIKKGALQAKTVLSQAADEAADRIAQLRGAKPETTKPVAKEELVDEPEVSTTAAESKPKKTLQEALDAFSNRKKA